MKSINPEGEQKLSGFIDLKAKKRINTKKNKRGTAIYDIMEVE